MDTSFSRALLREVFAEVKQADTTIKWHDASVIHTAFRGTWEFWFRGFYWHGRADDAYEARAKGWEAWLETREVSNDESVL